MIDQLVIGVAGVSTVFLSQSRRPQLQRWACLIGFAAQPAWMWATWRAGQWAMFGLTFVYAAGWARGIWNFWIRPARERAAINHRGHRPHHREQS